MIHVHIGVHASIRIDSKTTLGEASVASGEDFDAVDKTPDFARANESPGAPAENIDKPKNFEECPKRENAGEDEVDNDSEGDAAAEEADVDSSLLAVAEIPVIGANGTKENTEQASGG